jgi:hypothetical protein
VTYNSKTLVLISDLVPWQAHRGTVRDIQRMAQAQTEL